MAEPEPEAKAPSPKPKAGRPAAKPAAAKPAAAKPAAAKPAAAKPVLPKPEAAAKPSPPTAAPKPEPVKGPPRTVLDVSGLVLGRAASRIAKRLLNGESVVVVYAEKSVVTGSRALVLETYRANRARGSVRSGPHFPRYPDRIFRRTVRGMLPHQKTRGREAFERLEVFIGCPPEFANPAPTTMDEARARPALRAPMTLEEISRSLGARL